MSVTAKPRIEAYIGATGSGKGVSIERRLAALKPPRLLIWDPRGEYAKQAKRVTLQGAVAAVSKAGAAPFKLRVQHEGDVGLEDAFGLLCRLSFQAADNLFLAEELSDVTKPSWAPPAWKKIMTQGRHQRLHIIGAAQRPALVDKNFLGNCTYIRVFTLRYRNDRVAMAESMDVPLADITALETTEGDGGTTINFLERNFREKLLRKGQIKLSHRG